MKLSIRFGEILVKAFVFVVILLVTLKISDSVVGRFLPGAASYTNAGQTPRHIPLREAGVNVDTVAYPGETYILHTEGLEMKAYRVRTDGNGFMIGEADLQKDVSSPYDVMFFGGSTTECLYIDEGKRFPYLVGESLQRPDGERIASANAGVSGINSLQSLFILLSKGLAVKPKVAVLMHNVNDLSTLINSKSYWETAPSRAIVEAAPPLTKQESSFTAWLESTFRLFSPNIARMTARVLSSRDNASREKDEWKAHRLTTPPTAEESLSAFRASLTSFVRICKAWDITPVLMTQFNRLQEDDTFVRKGFEEGASAASFSDYAARYRAFNDAIRQVAAAEGCLLIDLDREVQPAKDLLYDSVHLNQGGSEKVAQIVSQQLAQAYPRYFVLVDPGSEKSAPDLSSKK